MSKIEEKKSSNAPAANTAPQTLPACSIDCTQAEKLLWLVKVNKSFNYLNRKKNKYYSNQTLGAKIFS